MKQLRGVRWFFGAYNSMTPKAERMVKEHFVILWGPTRQSERESGGQSDGSGQAP